MPGFSFTLGVSRLHMANWLCLSCRKFNTSTRETDRKKDCTLGWAQSLQVWCLPTVCLYLRLNWLNCMLLTQADSPYLVKTLFSLFQLYIRNIARHVGQFFNYSFSTVFKHADQRTWCLSYVFVFETGAQSLEYYHRLAQNSTNIFHDSKRIFLGKGHSSSSHFGLQ